MANKASNKIKELLATASINFSTDTFKIILMQSGFTFNPDSHYYYSNVSSYELSTGNGYTAGGATLSNIDISIDTYSDVCNITWDNVQWTASGGPIGPTTGAIIYDDTVTNDPVVGYIDFGGSYTQSDGGTATLVSPSVRIS